MESCDCHSLLRTISCQEPLCFRTWPGTEDTSHDDTQWWRICDQWTQKVLRSGLLVVRMVKGGTNFPTGELCLICSNYVLCPFVGIWDNVQNILMNFLLTFQMSSREMLKMILSMFLALIESFIYRCRWWSQNNRRKAFGTRTHLTSHRQEDGAF